MSASSSRSAVRFDRAVAEKLAGADPGGGSPRGIKASAHFADHIFAASRARSGKIRHRKALDEALLAEGRDRRSGEALAPPFVGLTEDEAQAKKRRYST